MHDFLTLNALNIVRVLAFSSLFGLLFAIGLETRFKSVVNATRNIRAEAAIIANFFLIPTFAAVLIRAFHLSEMPSRAMILLAAAPFAPVVPLYVRMAGGNLALATGLTGIFPILAALLTPASMGYGLWLIGDTGTDLPSTLSILEVLMISITLPLTLGMALREWWPGFALRSHKPIEWLSEAMGVVSLAFLTSLEASHLSFSDALAMLPSLCFYEGAFITGYFMIKAPIRSRLVMSFGTANRNIGLAVLLAASSDMGLDLLGDVLGQSILMLAVGLVHVAAIRGASFARQRIEKLRIIENRS